MGTGIGEAQRGQDGRSKLAVEGGSWSAAAESK